MEEVILRIGDKSFKANKQLLCEYSDYFRAMFSGFYVESEKHEIKIDILDPKILSIILQYMHMGMILLSEHSLSTIGEIATAANFLQITELTKQIQYVLDIQLSESNWLETMVIAQNASYSDLEQYSAAYGLYSFNSMKPENISTIDKLVWYLSHPYLDAQSELDVFKFGFSWLCKYNKLDDTNLVFSCLDMQRVSYKNLLEIKELLHNRHFNDSLVLENADCLLYLTSKELEISESCLNEHETELCEKFSERVWSDIVNIVKDSRPRLLKYVPVVPLWILKMNRPVQLPHCLYTFEEDKGFEIYLEVAERNLWGWNVAAWGLTKLVIVCGEHGSGSGTFMTDVKVYDTLKKKWTQFGVQLPPRRHAGVTTVGDLLYIVGGVGEFRVVLETAVVYDLKERSARSIAKLPDAIQCPAVCTHDNKVYAAGHKNILRYETYDNRDFWVMSVATDMRMSFMTSYNGYIYCAQSYFRRLYRFRPNVDEKLEHVVSFANLPSAICNLGNGLMVFTQTEFDGITVEEYKDGLEVNPRILSVQMESMRVNVVAGSCSLVMTLPPLCTELTQYHRQHLEKHSKA